MIYMLCTCFWKAIVDSFVICTLTNLNLYHLCIIIRKYKKATYVCKQGNIIISKKKLLSYV